MHFRLITGAGQARNPHSCLLWRRFVVQPVRSSSIASDRSTWPRAEAWILLYFSGPERDSPPDGSRNASIGNDLAL